MRKAVFRPELKEKAQKQLQGQDNVAVLIEIKAVFTGQAPPLVLAVDISEPMGRTEVSNMAVSNKGWMGCASGKKTAAECRPLPCVGACPALTQSAVVEEAVAPVSLLLMAGEQARPQAARAALLPKKPLAGNKDELLTLSITPSLEKPQNCTVPTSPSTLELSLPSVRNITGSKVAFNKSKYQVANMTFAEIGLGPVPKPPSSLSLLRPQAPLFQGSSGL